MDGPVDEMGMQARTLEDEVFIAASVEAVWRALTEPDELLQWFPDEAVDIEPEPGGRFVMNWKGGGTLNSRFLTFVPNQTLSYGFHGGESEPVTFTLTARDSGTEVALSHTVPEGSRVGMLLSITQNWAHLLVGLKCWVERQWDIRESAPRE